MIELTVNGTSRRVDAEGTTPLLYALRNDLRLNGAKYGCGLGQCGACMVVMDGAAVPSCVTPLADVAGRAVTTVEGLLEDGQPGPLQRAFLTEQAAQCGYCTAGIIMSAHALLLQSPQPDEAEVRSALDVNLCRCGSHNRVVRAMLRAAREA